MHSRATYLAAAGGGALFVVLFVVGFGIQPTHAPDSGDSASKVLHYYADNRGRLLVGDFLIACSALPLGVLIAALHRLMRRAEGPDGWLSTAMLVGAVTSGGAFLAGTAALATLAYRPVTSPPVARMLLDAGFITLDFSGIVLGLFVAAISASALLHRVVPAWVGWLGVPVAALQVVGGGMLASGDSAFSPQGVVAIVAALSVAVWTLALAIGLVLAARADRSAAPAT